MQPLPIKYFVSNLCDVHCWILSRILSSNHSVWRRSITRFRLCKFSLCKLHFILQKNHPIKSAILHTKIHLLLDLSSNCSALLARIFVLTSLRRVVRFVNRPCPQPLDFSTQKCPPPPCFFRFALASSFLVVLTARSLIEKTRKNRGL